MMPLAVLALASLVVSADCGDQRVPCSPGDNPASVAGLPPDAAADEGPPEPPRAPRGAWWYGAMVPVPYQRHVYYPTWDTPVRLFLGLRPMGTPALEVPQVPAVPAYWKPLDW